MVIEPPAQRDIAADYKFRRVAAEFNCTAPSCVYVPASRVRPVLFAMERIPPAELLMVLQVVAKARGYIDRPGRTVGQRPSVDRPIVQLQRRTTRPAKPCLR